jgi:hypothetical protein
MSKLHEICQKLLKICLLRWTWMSNLSKVQFHIATPQNKTEIEYATSKQDLFCKGHICLLTCYLTPLSAPNGTWPVGGFVLKYQDDFAKLENVTHSQNWHVKYDMFCNWPIKILYFFVWYGLEHFLLRSHMSNILIQFEYKFILLISMNNA